LAITKTAKVEAEIEKVKDKISELQTRQRELEAKKNEIENSEIVGIVRGMSIPLDQLATLLTTMQGGGTLAARTSGQNRGVDKPHYWGRKNKGTEKTGKKTAPWGLSQALYHTLQV